MPDPLEIYNQAQSTVKYKTYRLPSGGIVNAEILSDTQIRISSVCSTDPMDYMDSDIFPGSILELGILKNRKQS
jgi:hypothetical protein